MKSLKLGSWKKLLKHDNNNLFFEFYVLMPSSGHLKVKKNCSSYFDIKNTVDTPTYSKEFCRKKEPCIISIILVYIALTVLLKSPDISRAPPPLTNSGDRF